jgi:ACR3 family arsenite efflux pump ArsB
MYREHNLIVRIYHTSSQIGGLSETAGKAILLLQKGPKLIVNMRSIVSSCLVIALGLILTYHFILFWIQGQVVIEEPNKIICLLETVMGFAVIAFGVERLVRA